MEFENYEGTAIDSSVFEAPDEQTTVEPTTETTELDVNTEETNVDSSLPNESSNQSANTYNIPGIGEVTADEIIEWKNGGLRQADYTRKTQEVARQREENNEALELFHYLQDNPHIVEAMKNAEANPNSVINRNAPTLENQMLKDVMYRQRAFETDMKLRQLHEKYGDIDEVALLNKATELRTDDLEFVYKALSYDTSGSNRQALIDEAKEQLRAELLANKEAVTTTVNTTQNAQINNTPTLTNEERRIAKAMGMTEAEYSKWR